MHSTVNNFLNTATHYQQMAELDGAVSNNTSVSGSVSWEDLRAISMNNSNVAPIKNKVPVQGLNQGIGF